MDEKTILILVFGCLGYIASFFAGYSVGKARRLASDNDLHTDDGSRAAEAAERTQDLIGATESIADIIKRYENSVTEKQEMDNDMVDSNSDDID